MERFYPDHPMSEVKIPKQAPRHFKVAGYLRAPIVGFQNVGARRSPATPFSNEATDTSESMTSFEVFTRSDEKLKQPVSVNENNCGI